ncbi:MAG: DUF488 family protein [Sphingorhabdus sp.]
MKMFTIGYEGAEIGDFLETLDILGIDRVVDIRDLPASRRRDFSKNILSAHLNGSGISYSHFKALGDPKEGREAMRSGNRQRFLEVFNARMSTEAAQSALEEVKDIALSETIVLLCYERDHKDCHRSIVADELKRLTNIEVKHAGVRKDAQKFRTSMKYGVAAV